MKAALLVLTFAFRLFTFDSLVIVGRDAEVVHPLVHLGLLHAAAPRVVSRRSARRLRRVKALPELARPYDLDAAAPHVIRQSPVRRNDLQRPALARRLDQILYARVSVPPALRV